MSGNDNHDEQSNNNGVPAPRADTGEVIGVRKGMFGANNGGDTSGYGGLVRTVTLPGATSRPYGGWFDEVADELEGALEEQDLLPSSAIEKTVVDRGELTFHIAREHLVRVARTLRDDPALRFELCTGVSGVHFLGDKGRELHAVYHLRSITHGRLHPAGGVGPGQRSAHPVPRRGLPDQRLARARDLRLLRARLRRAPRPHPDHDAGRLAGLPAAQGLPARRHRRRVQGRPDPGSGPAEVVLLMSTPHATPRATTEGTVYTVTGGDWDEVVESAAKSDDERIIVNMGPQHPSTHGVLRLILEIDGETVTEARCGIGYLHTGIEKNLEFRNWTQGTTFVTRMDYLTPFFNEAAYCLGVEKLLGIEDQIPDRATILRVLLMELNRISSHLVCIATGGMELGATTIMIYGFRDRELVLDLFELITGLRMNHAFIRPGGLAQDLPPGAIDQLREFVKTMKKNLPEYDKLATGNPIFKARMQDVGYLDLTGCMALGVTGPMLRSAGLPHDLRKTDPYCGYENYEFDVPTADTCDAYGRFLIRLEEMRQSLRIVEQCIDRLAPGPVMVADKKIAW